MRVKVGVRAKGVGVRVRVRVIRKLSRSIFALPCLVLSCLVLSCLVLSCLVLFSICPCLCPLSYPCRSCPLSCPSRGLTTRERIEDCTPMKTISIILK